MHVALHGTAGAIGNKTERYRKVTFTGGAQSKRLLNAVKDDYRTFDERGRIDVWMTGVEACESLLFGSKLGFRRILDSLYGAFWRCSRVRL